MSEQEFNVVSKAKHYNSHPCGIEVKHVVRCLDFNLGNVFKYVTRREGKEELRSLKSARFYLLDHLDNIESCPGPLESKRMIVEAMVQRYATMEPHAWAQLFYKSFIELVKDETSVEAHANVLMAIDALIREQEPEWEGGTIY